MRLSAIHKKNMEIVAEYLISNPDVDFDYSMFSNVDIDDEGSLDTHTLGDPLGWAGAILGRPAGMNFVEFADKMLGLIVDEPEFDFISNNMLGGLKIIAEHSLTDAEYAAMQFSWIADGKSVSAFLKELGA